MRKPDDADKIPALFRLYEKKMYHIAYAILHDTHQAEDAVMEAFVRIIEHSYPIEDPDSDSVKRLIISVVRSAAIDLYRKNQRSSSKLMLMENPDICRKETAAVSGMNTIENGEDLIRGLPEIYRDVLRERFIKEKSISETAEVLGISEANVRKRQERALRMLKEDRKERDRKYVGNF